MFIPRRRPGDAIAKMAKQIKADVGDNFNPLFVGILNGLFMFTAELMRQMDDTTTKLRFARYSSSYRGPNSTGVVREIMPVQADVKRTYPDPAGRHYRYRLHHAVCYG